jgi:hypothetical protein
VRRARIQYFVLLGFALFLFAVADWLTPGAGDVWSPGAARFAVLVLGIGCSVATWGTAVTITSVYKRSWALWLSTAIVVVAAIGFALSCYRLPD